ncbi:MAG: primosomal protein N', partial [Campylobacteraceae bacterium]|nr:primosomal protein N' [Campylobacteraceae bacterium]
MIYFKVALLKSPLEYLTYQSEVDIEIGTKVQVSLQRRKVLSDAVVIKKTQKPSFKCKSIDVILPYIYSQFMIDVSKFISEYYVCSLGEALSLYHPFSKDIEYKENTNDDIISD